MSRQPPLSAFRFSEGKPNRKERRRACSAPPWEAESQGTQTSLLGAPLGSRITRNAEKLPWRPLEGEPASEARLRGWRTTQHRKNTPLPRSFLARTFPSRGQQGRETISSLLFYFFAKRWHLRAEKGKKCGKIEVDRPRRSKRKSPLFAPSRKPRKAVRFVLFTKPMVFFRIT